MVGTLCSSLPFQSTLPHGERPASTDDSVAAWLFQSTLPHGERRLQPRFRRFRPGCFNPRSRTGSDIQHPRLSVSPSGFNPRSRTGSDLQPRFRRFRPGCFNPRSRTGSDNGYAVTPIATREFQSTLPHGERLRRYSARGTGARFQSTLPHGERLKRFLRRRLSRAFQSTLPHGERLGLLCLVSSLILVSIHAPARGATVLP